MELLFVSFVSMFVFFTVACRKASYCFLLQHFVTVFGWKSGRVPPLRALCSSLIPSFGGQIFHCSDTSSAALSPRLEPRVLVWMSCFFSFFFFLPFHPSAHPACDLFPPQRPSRPSSKHASASTSPSTSRSSLPLPSSGETRLVDFPPGMETLEKI